MKLGIFRANLGLNNDKIILGISRGKSWVKLWTEYS